MYTGYVTHSRYKRDEDVFKAHHEAISEKSKGAGCVSEI